MPNTGSALSFAPYSGSGNIAVVLWGPRGGAVDYVELSPEDARDLADQLYDAATKSEERNH